MIKKEVNKRTRPVFIRIIISATMSYITAQIVDMKLIKFAITTPPTQWLPSDYRKYKRG